MSHAPQSLLPLWYCYEDLLSSLSVVISPRQLSGTNWDVSSPGGMDRARRPRPPDGWTMDIRHRASSETWSHHSHHSHHSVRSNCQIQLAAHWRNKNYSCHPHRSRRRLIKITLKKGKTLWLYNYLLTKPIWCQKNSSDQLTLKTHTAAQLGWKPSSAPGTSSCSTCKHGFMRWHITTVASYKCFQ